MQQGKRRRALAAAFPHTVPILAVARWSLWR